MQKTIVTPSGLVGRVGKPDRLVLDSQVGVYACVCQITKSAYIGQSTRIQGRIKEHLSNLKSGRYQSNLQQWQSDFNEHGESAFSFQTLQTCEGGELLDLETMYISKYVADGWFVYNNRLVTNEHSIVQCNPRYTTTIRRLIKALDRGAITIDAINQAIDSFE